MISRSRFLKRLLSLQFAILMIVSSLMVLSPPSAASTAICDASATLRNSGDRNTVSESPITVMFNN